MLAAESTAAAETTTASSFERSPAMDQSYISIKFENILFSNFIPILSTSPPPPASSPSPFQGPALSLKNAEFSAGDRIGDFGPGRNLRPTKTPQDEISGRKLLRPKPLESVPHFFCPLPSPSPSNKAGWAFTVNCSGIINHHFIQKLLKENKIINRTRCRLLFANSNAIR